MLSPEWKCMSGMGNQTREFRNPRRRKKRAKSLGFRNIFALLIAQILPAKTIPFNDPGGGQANKAGPALAGPADHGENRV